MTVRSSLRSFRDMTWATTWEPSSGVLLFLIPPLLKVNEWSTLPLAWWNNYCVMRGLWGAGHYKINHTLLSRFLSFFQWFPWHTVFFLFVCCCFFPPGTSNTLCDYASHYQKGWRVNICMAMCFPSPEGLWEIPLPYKAWLSEVPSICMSHSVNHIMIQDRNCYL